MKRLPDWQARLYALIESRREAAFSWGTNDCAMFCADMVLAITGEDLADQYRGAYSDEAGAQTILAEFGGIEALATALLGEPLGPLCARAGDIALIRTRHGEVVGVVEGNHVACVGDSEQILFPLSQALKCWRVG